jgi:hypothetical protein
MSRPNGALQSPPAGLRSFRDDRGPGVEITAEIEIRAPAALVWQILSDFGGYASWNPLIPRVRGAPAPETAIELSVRLPGAPAVPLRAVLATVDPPRELRWVGNLWSPRIFQGDHQFLLCPSQNGTVRFVQRELLRGALTVLLRTELGVRFHLGFDAMNRALKQAAEGRWARDSGSLRDLARHRDG